MKDKIVVIGGGGHAKVIISILKKLNQYNIVGYTDPGNKVEILGVLHLGNDEEFLNKKGNIVFAAVGIGENINKSLKKSIIEKYKKSGFHFPSIISPLAIINEEVSIGEGTVILDGVIINPCTKIGDFVTIYSNCVIEHDSIIENYVYLAPAVNMCGGVIIGADSTIGNGVSIKDCVKIKPGSKFESGSILLNDN